MGTMAEIQTWIVLGLFALVVITFSWGLYMLREGFLRVWHWIFPPKVNVDDSLLTQEQKNEIKEHGRRCSRKNNLYFVLAVLIGVVFLGEYVWGFWSEAYANFEWPVYPEGSAGDDFFKWSAKWFD